MPTKYRLSAPDVAWMLKRASRIAAALTNMKPAAHPSRPSGCNPQLNDSTAGATPNEITSASESNWRPNALSPPVSRAMRPSSMSSTNAKPMNGAAVSNSPRIAYTMHAYPQNMLPSVNKLGRM